MDDPNAIDEAALAGYLEAHVDGFRDLRSVTKFKSGQSNPTYMIDAASGRYVLRAKPPGKLLKSAHQVDREFRIIKALQTTDFPVPKVMHLSNEDSPIGRMFYVMEFVEGRILWDPTLPEATGNEERSGIYDAMNKTLAALHAVDPAAVGLADFGKPGSYFERQLSRWTDQYRNSETGTVADMDNLIAWLTDNLPADDGKVALVHGDYRLDNMIFEKDANRVLAVLDWVDHQPALETLPVGVAASGTTCGAAVRAAAKRNDRISALVCRSGRPDLAGAGPLRQVHCPTRFIVAEGDPGIARYQQPAFDLVPSTRDWQVVDNADEHYRRPGTLEQAARLTVDWFERELPIPPQVAEEQTHDA